MPYWKTHTDFWETSPFFRLLLPFITGIYCYEAFVRLIHYRNSFLIVLLVLAIVYTILKRPHLLRSVVMHGALFLAGYMAAFTSDIKNDKRWFGRELSEMDGYVVQVQGTPQEKERTIKLQVQVEKAISGDSFRSVKGPAFIYVYKNDSLPHFHAGDRLMVPSSWQPLKNPGNPHEFDYAAFCRRNNIYYQQFLNNNEVIRITEGRTQDLSPAARIHEWAMRRLEVVVKDKSTLGLLQAMLLGDEINFSDEDRQLYVDTGIIHVVAISGGHIAFLMLLITFALSWIRKKKHQWIKMAIAIPMVIFYVMVAGAPPSAVRAAVMFSLLGVSLFLNRDSNPLNTLFAAAFVILLAKPMWLFAVGFQLSFIAVLSLILFYKKIYMLYVSSNMLLRFIWKTVAASLAAEILVAPLVVYYFHQLPAAFLIANVIAALLMGLVMALGLAIILFFWLPVFSSLLVAVTVYLVQAFQYVIGAVRLLNPESFRYLHLTTVELLLCYTLIGAAALYLSKRSERRLHTALAVFCGLLLSFNLKQWRAMHREQIVIYNLSKHAYSEYLSGSHYAVLSESSDSVSSKKIDYASRENHVQQRAWKQMSRSEEEIIQFKDQKLLFLKSRMANDTAAFSDIDYLVLEYPVREFEAAQLLKTFSYKKLIVTGNQRRKFVQQWKDSCRDHRIDAHFTMLDGAYIINP